MQILHGQYTGNGSSQTVAMPFAARVLILKGGANYSVFWTDQMASGMLAYLSAVIANITTGGISNVTASGFDVGSDANVNASATDYYWLAIGGDTSEVATFSYSGNSTDNTDISISVATPILALVKRDGTLTSVFRSTTHGTNESSPLNSTIITTGIKSFGTSSIRLGTATSVNTTGFTYYGFALAAQAGFFTPFTWTGNGGSLSITGFGFAPGWVLGKASSGNTGILRSIESAAGYRLLNSGSLATTINSLDADGITLGSNASLNTNAVVAHGFAFKTLTGISYPRLERSLRGLNRGLVTGVT